MSNGESSSGQSGDPISGILGSTIGEGVGHYKSKLAWSRTKRMMQRRHQWEVKDLRLAGLNPMLSAGAAPSMGSPQQAGDQGWGAAGAAGAETGRKTSMDKASKMNLASQRTLLGLQGKKAISDIGLNAAHVTTQGAQQRGIDAQTRLTEIAAGPAELEALFDTTQMGQWLMKYSKASPLVRDTIAAIQAAAVWRIGGGVRGGAGAAPKSVEFPRGTGSRMAIPQQKFGTSTKPMLRVDPATGRPIQRGQ